MKIFNKIGELILEIESESLRGADLRDADLRGAYLRGDDLSNANFQGADLRGADLRDTDLRDAYFRGANLSNANFQGADLRGADLIILQIDLWTSYITTNHIRIGCQSYTLSEWENFTDEEISNMHSKALGYWKKNKEVIISLCKRFNNNGE